MIKFFEDRSLYEVAAGLKEDLKANSKLNQANLLGMMRNAVTQSQNVAYTSTNERAIQKKQSVELLPQSQSDAIMEKLMSKMVQRPTILAQEKDKDLNKKIEKIFELDSFQKMVDRADGKSLLGNTQSFINQSELIQK